MPPDATIFDGLAAVGRAALGLTFLVSGIAKLRDLSAFVAGALVYQVLPARMVRPLARLLPFVEVGLGLALIGGIGGRPALALALILVLVFSVAVIVNLHRGHSIPCYCLGVSSNEVIGVATLARLVVLGVMAAVALRYPRMDLWTWSSEPSLLIALGSTVLSISTLLWWLAPTETIVREAWFIRRATRSLSGN